MQKIESFKVNHDTLEKGMYVSRMDGDVITYDIRMKLPNGGDYLTVNAAHTFEHLFATYARNTEYGKEILYVGPMGCQTGFYLLTRDTLKKSDAIALVQASMQFIRDYEGEIPGNTAKECGNYKAHDLLGAKMLGKDMYAVLENWTEKDLIYKE